MSRLTEQIEALLKAELEANEGRLEFSRRALATHLNCVPSQISYVLQTRFTSELGYRVEGRRGGGGSILLYRIQWTEKAAYVMHLVNTLKAQLSVQEASLYLNALKDARVLDIGSHALFKAALSRRALEGVSPELAPKLRSEIFKTMLLALLEEKA